jgi:hypothetical protein
MRMMSGVAAAAVMASAGLMVPSTTWGIAPVNNQQAFMPQAPAGERNAQVGALTAAPNSPAALARMRVPETGAYTASTANLPPPEVDKSAEPDRATNLLRGERLWPNQQAFSTQARQQSGRSTSDID